MGGNQICTATRGSHNLCITLGPHYSTAFTVYHKNWATHTKQNNTRNFKGLHLGTKYVWSGMCTDFISIAALKICSSAYIRALSPYGLCSSTLLILLCDLHSKLLWISPLVFGIRILHRGFVGTFPFHSTVCLIVDGTTVKPTSHSLYFTY